jgi:hypothetical protein
VDLDIAAFSPPELLECLPECGDEGLSLLVLGKRHQHADASHPVGLLRTRCERPCSSRTPEKRDELAPLHVRSQAKETALYRLKRVL